VSGTPKCWAILDRTLADNDFKSQVPNPKLQIRIKSPNLKMNGGSKPRDLEERTFEFAQSVRAFVKQLPRTVSNTEDIKQLVRASGSVAANWSEADEALSKKGFLMHVKICRKEAKESRLFLRLVIWSFSNGLPIEILV